MTEEDKARTAFVISPIGVQGSEEHRHALLALNFVIKKALTGPRWTVVRADQESSPDSITTQVIKRIIESDLIVADLTDHNPNVFYELAVAHGYRRPVIHLMKAGQKVPFDVGDQRVISYDLTNPESVDNARKAIVKAVEWLDDNADQARNPLSSFEQFRTISGSSDATEAGSAVAGALERISSQIAALQRASFPAPHSIEYDSWNDRRRHLEYRYEDVSRRMNALKSVIDGGVDVTDTDYLELKEERDAIGLELFELDPRN